MEYDCRNCVEVPRKVMNSLKWNYNCNQVELVKTYVGGIEYSPFEADCHDCRSNFENFQSEMSVEWMEKDYFA